LYGKADCIYCRNEPNSYLEKGFEMPSTREKECWKDGIENPGTDEGIF
jgi:hypothetical protein